jgi:hypothetical protein
MEKIKNRLIAAFIICIVVACSKSDSSKNNAGILTVITATPIQKTEPQAVTLGGDVTKDGGKPVTEKGICAGEAINPVITNPENLTEKFGTGLGVFSGDLDLENPEIPAGTYHYRAYAKNAETTVYGEDKTFIKN